tara:strand:+ start:93 stop:251 length:159 start_codon:yes stop_codon:yes gene_type:complete
MVSCTNDDEPSNDDACPAIYQPVCGSDGIEYCNECYARVAGITEFTTGECFN